MGVEKGLQYFNSLNLGIYIKTCEQHKHNIQMQIHMHKNKIKLGPATFYFQTIKKKSDVTEIFMHLFLTAFHLTSIANLSFCQLFDTFTYGHAIEQQLKSYKHITTIILPFKIVFQSYKHDCHRLIIKNPKVKNYIFFICHSNKAII